MQKTAVTQSPILDLIANRWSPVGFADRVVEKDKLRSLFEAGRWAPSSYNEQPWHFIVGTKDEPELFAKILSCLKESNRAWAQNAPVLMLSVTRMNFARNGNPNRHAFHDIGLAVENMVIQATSLGLSVHQMAGIEPEKVHALFALPEGYEAVTGIAIGYTGEADALTPELKQRQLAPRSRKPLQEFIFGNGWGEASKIVAE